MKQFGESPAAIANGSITISLVSPNSGERDCSKNLAESLFGELALRNGIIDLKTLEESTARQLTQPTKSLAQILLEMGVITEAEKQAIDVLAARQLRHVRHDLHDTEATTDSFSTKSQLPSVRPRLDPTIGYVPAANALQRPPGNFGHYELLGEVARGGMGVVYKARQTKLNRLVALKMIRSGELADENQVKRFYAEAEAAAKLDHPGIVQVYEVGEIHGQHFFSMAFVPGRSLNDRVKADGPLPPRMAATLLREVAQAVQFAHDKGIIHRDIKPHNILLDENEHPRVTDFGLAKHLQDVSEMTATGEILGTPSYMPPEQAAGRTDVIGRAADVYSLGATLYCVLTGHPPFQASSLAETIRQVLEVQPISLRRLNPEISRDLDTICLKCLRKEPERRYASAREVAEDLGCWLNNKPITARPIGFMERSWLWCKRRPGFVGLSLAFLVILMVGALGGTWIARDWQNAARAAGLVDALMNAETEQVPGLVADLAPYRRWADPLLRNEHSRAATDPKKLLHASLALLPEDPSLVNYLFGQLLVAEPPEVSAISSALLPHKDALVEQLWNVAERPKKGQESCRLRAAAALAKYDPENQRWKKIQTAVANDLAKAPTVYVSTWMNALRPIKERLLDPLSEIFSDANRRDMERSTATDILADYAAKDPAKLSELLVKADDRQFAVIFSKVEAQQERALPLLIKVIDSQLSPDVPSADEQRDLLAKRQANAAVALFRLHHSEKVWPLLRYSADPRVRSYLLHRLPVLEADPAVILKHLLNERDVTIRRALLLCIGEFPRRELPVAERTSWVPKFQAMYCTDTDPGLHACVEWLLRKWGQEEWLKQTNGNWAIDKEEGAKRIGGILEQIDAKQADATQTGPRWYVNSQGQTYVVVPGPVEFLMGSPKSEKDRTGNDRDLQKRRINRSFAIASKPVTLAEYRNLTKVSHNYGTKFNYDPDLPVTSVNWFLAAKYCNLLSKSEGIPEDQCCYVTDAKGDVIRLKPNYLSLVGYRLPTGAEMEYATRAGTTTCRYYGETEELLAQYAWYAQTFDEGLLMPVARKKPNDLGLFDTLGNCLVWCQEEDAGIPFGKRDLVVDDKEGTLDPAGVRQLVTRGGAYTHRAPSIRSASRNYAPPAGRFSQTGFRPAKTIVRQLAN